MNEEISALLDGELEGERSAAVLDAVLSKGASAECWRQYQIIGEVLRGGASSARMQAAVMQRLQREPTLSAAPPTSVLPKRAANDSANDPFWQRLLPVAAALMGVAVVVWGGLSLREPPLPTRMLAVKAERPQAGGRLEVLSQEQAYLLAHQAYSGAGAVPGVANYLHTVAAPLGEPAQ